MSIVAGNLFDSDCDLIIIQDRCIPYRSKRDYAMRNSQQPKTYPLGTCRIIEPAADKTFYTALFYANYFPFKSGVYQKKYNCVDPYVDNPENRLQRFTLALQDLKYKLLAGYPDITKIGIPYKFCAVYGGIWKDYYRVIKNFANSTPQFEIVVYKYPE